TPPATPPAPLPAKIIPVEKKAPAVEPVQKKEVAAVTPVPIDTKPLPKIVIVIDDLGIDKSRTARTIQLPGPLTLSFMTYATELSSQTEAARKAGHELWMHIPMEPGSTDVDPGPNVLLTGIPEAELLNSLNWNLDQFSGYVGVNNHMGSRFTADRAGMNIIMKALKKRGLFFLDSITTGKTVGRKAARKYGVPFAGRNIFLDHQDDLQSIEKRLREVEKLARKNGTAIAIGHPREATLKALGAWLKEIEAKGFRLVTLSSVIKKP
ncbi:MAG: divergent polysaccharide deacetylase family protein, partial [Proteobacteria bacterium]|nr:divergent polysaccharide deacetylase family protein [Pseudomonadota bacterium]